MSSTSSFYTIINDVYDAAQHALKMVISMVHTHSATTGQGGQLDWDTIWSDAVHSHASDAEGGTIDHGTALTGLTDDDHTQYQKESLLTTAGDLPYATGASTWARLGIGTVGQLLRTNAGATAPEWATAVSNMAIGSYTGNDATARQIAVGFLCRLVIVITSSGPINAIFLPSGTIAHWASTPYHADIVATNYLHATDGFVVDDTSTPNMNNALGYTYYYFAIG